MLKQSSLPLQVPLSGKCDKCHGLLIDAASHEGPMRRCLTGGRVIFEKSDDPDAAVDTQSRTGSRRESDAVVEGKIGKSSRELPTGNQSKYPIPSRTFNYERQ